jgi:hypothetical protein
MGAVHGVIYNSARAGLILERGSGRERGERAEERKRDTLEWK